MKRRVFVLCVAGAAGALAAVAHQFPQMVNDDAGKIVITDISPSSDPAASTTKAMAVTADDDGPVTPWICQNDQDRTGITATDKMQADGANIALTGSDYDVLRGVNFRAFMKTTSNAYDEDGPNSPNYLSQHVYRQPMLDKAVAWHANVVRFQVSQWAMSGAVDRPVVFNQYSRCLRNAINLVRKSHLFVILAMQREENPATDLVGGVMAKMPTLSTKRAWRAVDDMLREQAGANEDLGIAYELWNEPGLSLYDSNGAVLAANWAIWRNGEVHGAADAEDHANDDADYIGHQQLLTWMRAPRTSGDYKPLGTKRLLIVEGLELGKSFQAVRFNVNPLNDSENNLAYAVHPYPKGYDAGDTTAQNAFFDDRFGFLTQAATVNGHNWSAVPVMVTEWMAGSAPGTGPGLQDLPDYSVALDLINYVRQKNIPLVVSAYDVPNGMLQQISPWFAGDPMPAYVWTPTNFDDFDQRQGTGGMNVGVLVCRFMLKGYDFAVPYSNQHAESAMISGFDGSDTPCVTE